MTPTCGCCATLEAARVRHANRPWLSGIEYRLGTFASFRQALLDELSATQPLRALQSRVSDDYAVSAIELWAAVADVLTFYSERIANEAFLRTATLRDSVLRMARLLDYQLAPGAAATTDLAFTLEREAAALIATGARVQSVPAQGETPQKYETLEPLAARGALNRLRIMPRPVARTPLSQGSVTDIVAPDPQAMANAGTLAPGQQVMAITGSAIELLTVADVTAHDDMLSVTWRQPPSQTYGEPIETWPGPLVYRLGRTFHLHGVDAPPTVVAARLKDATKPETAYLEQANTQFKLGWPIVLGAPTNEIWLDARYPNLKPGGNLLLAVGQSGGPAFAARTAKITAVADGSHKVDAVFSDLLTTTVSQTATVTHLTLDNAAVVDLKDLRDVTVYELLGDPLRFWPYAYPDHLGTQSVYVPGRRNGWSSLEVGRTVEKGKYKPGPTLDLADVTVGRRVIGVDEHGAQPVAARVAASAIVGRDLRVAATSDDQSSVYRLGLAGQGAARMTVLVSAPLPSSPIPSATGTHRLRVTIGALPTQTLSLDPTLLGKGTLAEAATALEAAVRGALPGAATFAGATVRAITAPGEPALYVAAGVPDDAISFSPEENDVATVTALGLAADQVRWVDGILSAPLDHALIGAVTPAKFEIALGYVDPPTYPSFTIAAPSDLAGVAAAIGAQFKGMVWLLRADDRLLIHPPAPVREIRSFLRLDLDTDAPLALDPDSAGLLANVAHASHGETVHDEIVGDGDASAAFQRFALRKSPTTYVPAAVPGGIATSLQLFVNSARWTEVSTLYGHTPTEAVFTTRLADDGVRTIQFGDGTTGARLPTGRMNVVATYRQGLGLVGRVRAATLTNLLDRPTGVKGVNNPLPADGGADPESLDRARSTVPGTVRTFGRAISLRDFEDATLLAGQVAKATAAWVWTQRRRVVHLTVAGQGGGLFSPAGLAELLATLDVERDPNQRLLIGNFVPVAILVSATIMVEPTYVAAAVLDATRAALLDALSFERRQFLDSVDLSDVYAVLQGVAGVRAVDVDRLDFKSTDVAFRKDHAVDPTKGVLQPRLHVLPARSSGSASTVLPAELPVIDVAQLDVVLQSVGGTTA